MVKQFKNIQEQFYKKLTTLMQIDCVQTIQIKQNHFKEEKHMKVIQNLEQYPKLQLKYLQNLIENGNYDEEDQEQLYNLYFKLICENYEDQKQREDKLIEILQKNMCGYEECLQLAKDYEIIDIQGYIYKSKMQYNDYFTLYLEQF